MAMNASGHYDNLPDESPSKDKRKYSTRDLNGSYILACRGEESLENTAVEPLSPISNKSREKVHHVDNTVYISIVNEDSDEEHDRSKYKRSRIISDSIADRSLPNPGNITDAPICRICHEGDEAEDLVSPCFCSGTVGALHMTCLEKWLGTADMTRCEICEFQFTVSKNPKPFTWFLKNKSLGKDRRYLIADILCAIIFIPLTLAVFTGCLVGASYFSAHDKDWQAVTLILVAMTSLLILCLWCGFTLRRNYILCSTWREHYREVKIKYNPPDKNNNRQPFNREASMSGRKLLEKPALESDAMSPDFHNKTITRKITYETSPSFQKKKHVDKVETENERCTLKPGTPYVRKKRWSLKNAKDEPVLTEDIKILELHHNDAHVYNKHLDRVHVHSTSTPAKEDSRISAFEERRCSATPIHRLPYIAVPLQTCQMEISHPGMFVETPYSVIHSNKTTRKGLLAVAAEDLCINSCSIPPDGFYENGK